MGTIGNFNCWLVQPGVTRWRVNLNCKCTGEGRHNRHFVSPSKNQPFFNGLVNVVRKSTRNKYEKVSINSTFGNFFTFLGMFLSKSEIELRLRPQYIVVIKNPYFSSFINRSAYLYINKMANIYLLEKFYMGKETNYFT